VAFQQHDIQELCQVLFEALEKASEELADFLSLYEGRLLDYIEVCWLSSFQSIFEGARTARGGERCFLWAVWLNLLCICLSLRSYGCERL
jgi:hypothetical protein